MTPKHSSVRKSSLRKKAYFFSDVHLGLGSDEENRQRELRLIAFLDRIKEDAGQIFILGDLFDFWFEYESVVQKGYYRLFAKLAELHEKNIRLFFIAGNHDYWMRDYFQREFGMELSWKPMEKEILGKRFYLHHGDGLLKDDNGYKILKSVLRNRISIFLFSLVPPDLSAKLARWSSKTSRGYTSNRSYEEHGMTDFAFEKIHEGYDVVIMGHNHKALLQKNGKGIYINLGDWIFENTYAVFDGKKIELKQWNH